jgi:hypothetical protein
MQERLHQGLLKYIFCILPISRDSIEREQDALGVWLTEFDEGMRVPGTRREDKQHFIVFASDLVYGGVAFVLLTWIHQHDTFRDRGRSGYYWRISDLLTYPVTEWPV